MGGEEGPRVVERSGLALDYLAGPRPRLFAHRGGAGVAPENTLEAFARGLAAGAERFELDVHATADGHVVVVHDPTVDRTTDGSGEVRSTPLSEIERLDAGHRFTDDGGGHPFRGHGVRIPTLAALLETFPGVPLNIEIKQGEPPIERAVLAVLDRFEARERVLLAAEDASIMARIRAVAPDSLTGFSTADVVEFFTRLHESGFSGYQPPGAALQIPSSFAGAPLVTAESVAAAHDLGVEVHVWTIDDPVEMEALLALGVDGLMTDRPARAVTLLRRLRLR
jgi:glycerophosphoryl diester phosphodiesterase